MIERLPCAKEV